MVFQETKLRTVAHKSTLSFTTAHGDKISLWVFCVTREVENTGRTTDLIELADLADEGFPAPVNKIPVSGVEVIESRPLPSRMHFISPVSPSSPESHGLLVTEGHELILMDGEIAYTLFTVWGGVRLNQSAQLYFNVLPEEFGGDGLLQSGPEQFFEST